MIIVIAFALLGGIGGVFAAKEFKSRVATFGIGFTGVFFVGIIGGLVALMVTTFLPFEGRTEVYKVYQLVNIDGAAGSSGNYVFASSDATYQMFYKDDSGSTQQLKVDGDYVKVFESEEHPRAEVRITYTKCSATPTVWTMLFSFCHLARERFDSVEYDVYVPDGTVHFKIDSK